MQPPKILVTATEIIQYSHTGYSRVLMFQHWKQLQLAEVNIKTEEYLQVTVILYIFTSSSLLHYVQILEVLDPCKSQYARLKPITWNIPQLLCS